MYIYIYTHTLLSAQPTCFNLRCAFITRLVCQVVPPLLGRRQLDARGCPSSLRRRPCFTVRPEVGSAAASSVGSAINFPTSYDQLLEQVLLSPQFMC